MTAPLLPAVGCCSVKSISPSPLALPRAEAISTVFTVSFLLAVAYAPLKLARFAVGQPAKGRDERAKNSTTQPAQ